MQTIRSAAVAAGLAVAMLLAVAPGGCATRQYADPIAKMMDKTESHPNRWAAVKQAEERFPSDPRRIAALKRLVWERGYPVEYSNYAIDELIRIDEAEARRFLASAIVLIEDWDTLNHLIARAVERNWTDFVPALVRSYAGKTPMYKDADRPERKAIEALVPGVPVQQSVLKVFAGDTKAEMNQRAAAWALLHRLTPDQNELVKLLASAPADDAMVADLRAGAADLAVVPNNLETITWLRMLRTPPYQAFWAKARAAVARLDPQQRAGLQMRHIPVIVHLAETNSGILTQSRDALLAAAMRFDAAGQHHLKGPTYDGPMDQHPQDLRHWAAQLTWGDLAALRLVAGLMSDPAVTSAWFQQATADEKDKSTEYGGLVRTAEDGSPIAVLYRPMMRRHDLIYYPPKELVTDAYTALAHYRFHAQNTRNRLYAGPGRGDLERIAGRQQFNGIVLTFIDANALNVDYYQPGEQVIDLGTIHR